MNHFKLVALAAVTAALSASSFASIYNFDVTGIDSFDGQGAAGNTVVSLNLGAGATITGIGWDVNLTANSPSWLQEIGVNINTSTNDSPDSINLNVGAGDDFSGSSSYTSGGIVEFSSVPLNNIVLNSDGILRLEFFESFDDVAGAADGHWDSGTLQIEYTAVPEPASMAALGLGALALIRKRRKSSK